MVHVRQLLNSIFDRVVIESVVGVSLGFGADVVVGCVLAVL